MKEELKKRTSYGYEISNRLDVKIRCGKTKWRTLLRRTLQQQQLVKQSFYLHGIIYKIRSYWIPLTNIRPHVLHPTLLQNSALRYKIPNYGAQEKLAGMQTHLINCCLHSVRLCNLRKPI
ncbi:hypothetical protein L3X38_014727 [Prunus dulcis]|uniref:Uncharacterized protein n=1 Tax=Prunus dulcis TaxID=3755 RepID=A0AAD4WNR2_PRUDU|nr:hypothetical protein L3X38_014727 [Prunus dulcis]